MCVCLMSIKAKCKWATVTVRSVPLMGTESKPQKEPMPDLRVATVAILPRKRGIALNLTPMHGHWYKIWDPTRFGSVDQNPKSGVDPDSRPTKFGSKIISPGQKSEPRKYVLKMKWQISQLFSTNLKRTKICHKNYGTSSLN